MSPVFLMVSTNCHAAAEKHELKCVDEEDSSASIYADDLKSGQRREKSNVE